MILIEAGDAGERGFEAKVLFAAQLASRGHDVVIDDRTLPPDLDRSSRYEAAPYLRDLSGAQIHQMVIVGAETLADVVLGRLRETGLAPDASVWLVGRFESRQALISAQSKVAYVIGREPQVIDLAVLQSNELPGANGPVAAVGPPQDGDGAAGRECLVVFLGAETLEDPTVEPALMALEHLRDLRLTVVVPGRARDHLKALRFGSLRVVGLSDLTPIAFARMAKFAVIYEAEPLGSRIAAIAADVIVSGGVVIDCTKDAGFATSSAPVLKGPIYIAALADYLRHTVVPNSAEILRQIANSPWTEARRIEVQERLMNLEPPLAARPARAKRILFLPTNGSGLGHARRSTLIAREMQSGAVETVFAAFPSCMPMIRAAGYECLPLVSKSRVHGADHANDLVNYMRLRRALSEGDRLVFDGGYVFDSIHRTILEKRLEATWIRRGLWQAGQITPAALHREGTFAQVIVPEEAFAELNTDLSFGRHVRKVGPIVGDRPARDAATTRGALRERLGREFDALVVTMLGGGVAADRTAQMQLLSALFERRKGCLHLILIWPGSTVPPALYGWKNTMVCQTRNAPDYAAAADLVVTAAGYNSFHEVLYHGLPAIFVPQMAGFMDDQDRRARAASDRGLAVTVAADELLLLEREVTALLDSGKGADLRRALAAVDLPRPGNKAAADLIAAEDWR